MPLMVVSQPADDNGPATLNSLAARNFGIGFVSRAAGVVMERAARNGAIGFVSHAAGAAVQSSKTLPTGNRNLRGTTGDQAHERSLKDWVRLGRGWSPANHHRPDVEFKGIISSLISSRRAVPAFWENPPRARISQEMPGVS
jgi:hypothetical protein